MYLLKNCVTKNVKFTKYFYSIESIESTVSNVFIISYE